MEPVPKIESIELLEPKIESDFFLDVLFFFEVLEEPKSALVEIPIPKKLLEDFDLFFFFLGSSSESN